MSVTDERSDALVAALVELEHHVSRLGFDQPPRLFALADAHEVVAREPHLVEQLSLQVDQLPPHALLAIEQDEFQPGPDLAADLARITWGEDVAGCAVTMVNTFLPSGAEQDMPDDPDAAADWVSQHPDRQEMRIAVGVLRGDISHGVARMASHPEELLGARDLVPGLAAVLAHTLEPDTEPQEEATP